NCFKQSPRRCDSENREQVRQCNRRGVYLIEDEKVEGRDSGNNQNGSEKSSQDLDWPSVDHCCWGTILRDFVSWWWVTSITTKAQSHEGRGPGFPTCAGAVEQPAAVLPVFSLRSGTSTSSGNFRRPDRFRHRNRAALPCPLHRWPSAKPSPHREVRSRPCK